MLVIVFLFPLCIRKVAKPYFQDYFLVLLICSYRRIQESLLENRPFVSALFSELLPAFFEPESEGDLIPANPRAGSKGRCPALLARQVNLLSRLEAITGTKDRHLVPAGGFRRE